MKDKVVLLSLLTVALTISIAVGISYAFWTQTESQEKDNIIKTGCFEISLLNQKNDIDLFNQFPITDTKGSKLVPYTFTIKNTCTIYAEYSVNLEKLADSTLDSQYVKVQLNEEKAQLYSAYTDASASKSANALESRTLTTGGLAADASVTYSLRVWLDKEGTNDTIGEKEFKAKVVVDAEAASSKA